VQAKILNLISGGERGSGRQKLPNQKEMAKLYSKVTKKQSEFLRVVLSAFVARAGINRVKCK